MKITRQNYEIWFIDFVDGNLNKSDEKLVRDFAMKNPDLAEELDEFSSFTLQAKSIEFKNKNILKQNKQTAIEGVTKFELLCISYLEKEISPGEQKELDHYLLNSAENKKSFDVIQRTKLSANGQDKYSSKNKLKKLYPIKSQAWKISAILRIAAMIVLLIGLTFIFNLNSKTDLTGLRLANYQTTFKLRKPALILDIEPSIINDASTPILIETQTEFIEERTHTELPKTLTAMKFESLQPTQMSVSAEWITASLDQKSHDFLNQTENKQINIEQKLKNGLISSGEYLANGFTKIFKKVFRYEKSYTDDGRTLIALKAGGFEYQISKKQRK